MPLFVDRELLEATVQLHRGRSMAPQAGYSGTPLAEKLRIRSDQSVVILDEPEDFRACLAPRRQAHAFGS